jgi:hypothetical protein
VFLHHLPLLYLDTVLWFCCGLYVGRSKNVSWFRH